MNIKILGTGCPNCQKLEQNVKQALKELNIDAPVDKIVDIQTIMSYGIMSTPAVVVDGEVVSYGCVLGVEEIKKLLAK
ncbi:redox-active disulfide protein 2 [Candidatus Falkowbacteria bacterium RIFOXYB2_FULL_38_15]|uniref:Redox-active disulfide protein 2 n=1 Tax=Candidatus Falkowbacteria bacterium RIFOXYA2_FULL_38_12 TaxID=1797993 RepID=A0A1F5S224_9BACT|nr:MAG: redox-active disulfide protein 2 [Candidatus Falkowbacteria bacterium RIFOXYA2_FULL_38_12]OGF32912.1 MAG: redox-active disulfide protein 2 [Candidatus Falkowbacteria bacterium RIFOXYB2_FULL_38_15]OGF44134.1 MAG: redox-active disulfide protein 2 [Candidatus Falkowbacteria bacterium RIFOXYD2_FULL_39_16]